MMLRAWVAVLAMGAALTMGGLPGAAALAMPTSSQEADGPEIRRVAARADFVEARQFRVANARVPGGGAGQPSSVQTVTAWQVAKGWWNGQSLDGLSLVLVQTVAEDGSARPSFNCYVSHLATPAQRDALVSAYAASQGRLPRSAGRPDGETAKPADTSGWRVEPAVIRIDTEGGRVVVHLGTIA